MIQGVINQLLAMGAAAKKASDLSKGTQEKLMEKPSVTTYSRAQEAKDLAMARMKEKVQAKYDQNEEFKKFKASLGINKDTPEALKKIVYEKWKVADAEMKKSGGDLKRFSPEAQAAIIREVNRK